MNCASVTLSATPATLKSLIGDRSPNEVSLLILQAPSGNAGIAYFGNSAIQTFELAAGDPFYYVPGEFEGGRLNLSEFYVKGTASDKLSVTWIQYGETH